MQLKRRPTVLTKVFIVFLQKFIVSLIIWDPELDYKNKLQTTWTMTVLFTFTKTIGFSTTISIQLLFSSCQVISGKF